MRERTLERSAHPPVILRQVLHIDICTGSNTIPKAAPYGLLSHVGRFCSALPKSTSFTTPKGMEDVRWSLSSKFCPGLWEDTNIWGPMTYDE
ncbi:unnamed protein product [Toxocara canis]|uniref:Uncharacterized protein n=1 Tax=Toxocara canis TaxID=6265 RepID=A0A183UXX6_TOXCA|nr:unnamed protein product [Toxocara canis]